MSTYGYKKESKKITKNQIMLITAGSILFLAWIFFFKMISPGYVGVVVNMFGEEKGAQPKELRVGMHWIAPWKKVYTFPIFEQNHIWAADKSFTFQTGEGLNVNADLGISYHLHEDKIHILFCKYRRGIEEITDLFIRNYARDAINKAASKMRIEDLYGCEKQSFLEDVQQKLRTDLQQLGIEIDRLYLIGTLHFPQGVVTALNAKIEAVQRAQQRENELREAEAQAKKEVATAQGYATSTLLKAKAEGESNAIVSNSLTDTLVKYESIKKWDGKLPQVMGEGIIPMISLKEGK